MVQLTNALVAAVVATMTVVPVLAIPATIAESTDIEARARNQSGHRANVRPTQDSKFGREYDDEFEARSPQRIGGNPANPRRKESDPPTGAGTERYWQNKPRPVGPNPVKKEKKATGAGDERYWRNKQKLGGREYDEELEARSPQRKSGNPANPRRQQADPARGAGTEWYHKNHPRPVGPNPVKKEKLYTGAGPNWNKQKLSGREYDEVLDVREIDELMEFVLRAFYDSEIDELD